jgi:hypothetical protein
VVRGDDGSITFFTEVWNTDKFLNILFWEENIFQCLKIRMIKIVSHSGEKDPAAIHSQRSPLRWSLPSEFLQRGQEEGGTGRDVLVCVISVEIMTLLQWYSYKCDFLFNFPLSLPSNLKIIIIFQEVSPLSQFCWFS